jgi:hypothetical protein
MYVEIRTAVLFKHWSDGDDSELGSGGSSGVIGLGLGDFGSVLTKLYDGSDGQVV